jgi:gluconate 2-dehydrogenase gamma chain
VSIMLTRKHALLASTAVLLAAPAMRAEIFQNGAGLPWRPFAGDPPEAVKPAPWAFFTAEEAAAVETLVDRLIPPDPDTPGGKDCGCAVFIDRQWAGAYGSAAGLYWSPPFLPATAEQGFQGPLTPAQLYRRVLAALDQHCRATYAGKTFAELPDSEKDSIIAKMEDGSLQLQGKDVRPFIDALLRPLSASFLRPVLSMNPLLEDNIDARQTHPRNEPFLADPARSPRDGPMAYGQTAQIQTLSLDGTRALLHAVEQKAQQPSAPSSLAVVDTAGDLILFEQTEGARPVGIDRAVGKARSAARFRKRPIRSRRPLKPAGRRQSPLARFKWTAACRSVSAARRSGRLASAA